MDMAQITIIGRLTGDPALRHIGEKKQVTEFRVAVNHRFRTEQGWQEKEPSYFNVECWDRLAENAAFTLRKGMPVVVVGRAEQSTWYKEFEDGSKEKRVMHRVNAQSVAPHLGERVATVQFDLKRSKKMEEELAQANRDDAAPDNGGTGMGTGHNEGASGDTSGTDVLRGSIGTQEGSREPALVGARNGFEPDGADAEPPEAFRGSKG